MNPPFKIPESFEEFSRLTQSELRELRGEIYRHEEAFQAQLSNAINDHLTEIITRLEGGTLPDHDTIVEHSHRMINIKAHTEIWSWRGTPILQITVNPECPRQHPTQYITLTILV